MKNFENYIENPTFISLYNNSIDVDEKSNIYYFHNYFNYSYVKYMDSDDNRRRNTCRILDFKKGYISGYTYYKRCLSCFDSLSGNWIICSIPGHDQVNSTINPMNNFLESANFDSNFHIEEKLIIRTKKALAKHEGSYGDRTIEKDLESLDISNIDVYNKNIIVFDDVTTTGSSLSAAKYLLYKKGAKHVVCIAFAKTFDKPYHYFF